MKISLKNLIGKKTYVTRLKKNNYSFSIYGILKYKIVNIINEKGTKKIFFIQEKNKINGWVKFMSEDVKDIQKDIESNSYTIYLK